MSSLPHYTATADNPILLQSFISGGISKFPLPFSFCNYKQEKVRFLITSYSHLPMVSFAKENVMLCRQMETAQSSERLPKYRIPLNAPRVSGTRNVPADGMQTYRVLDSVGLAAGGDEKYLKALQQQQMPLLQQLKGAPESCDQPLHCTLRLTFHHCYSRALKQSCPLYNITNLNLLLASGSVHSKE